MKIGILGCAGRMGRMLLSEVISHEGLELSGGTETLNHRAVGEDLGIIAGKKEINLKVSNNTKSLFIASDIVIDFTTKEILQNHTKLAKESNTLIIPSDVNNIASMISTAMSVIDKSKKYWQNI